MVPLRRQRMHYLVNGPNQELYLQVRCPLLMKAWLVDDEEASTKANES